MVVHWWRHRDAHWRKSLLFNALGATLSAIVFLTAAVTKFTAGAWVAVLAVGLFVWMALRIRRHYDAEAEATALHAEAVEVPGYAPFTPVIEAPSPRDEQAEREETPSDIRNLVIVPLAGLDLPSVRALAYAVSLRQPVLVLHLSPTEQEAARFRDYWHIWGDHLPLEVVVSSHRAIVAPLVNYIGALHYQRADLTLTVIVPEIVVGNWLHRLLHNQTAPRLRHGLRPMPKIVITSVPFHLPH
jgi:hypothetical protein